jgi:hypothetical protein
MFTHAYYRKGMPLWVKNLGHRKIGLRAVDAYFLYLKDARRLDERRVRHLLDAVRCPAMAVWTTAYTFLLRLAGKHSEILPALEAIAAAGKANERLQLAMALGHPGARRHLRREFLLKLFTLFVHDSSARVRLFGVQGADQHCLTELLPRVRWLAAYDPHGRTRQSAAFHLPRLETCFYTHWYETRYGGEVYVLRTPEGEKWFLIRPGDVPDYLDHDRTAARLLATHRKRTSIAWDYAKCRPGNA